MTEEALLPCPFCGEGETEIRENTMWSGQSQVILSVSIRHFCPRELGQPTRAIERIGRDRESAIKAWNQRAPSPKLPTALMDDVALKAWEWPFPTGPKPKLGL